jgi:phosphoglycerate dehydrogenase-like enzyme
MSTEEAAGDNARKVLYLAHATDALYDVVRAAVPPGFTLVTLDGDDPEEPKRKIRDADVVIVGNHGLRRPLLDCAERLQLVHHQGVGYHDTMDVDAVAARGLPLALTPEGTTSSVAEHTIMLMLMALRHAAFADAEIRQGRFHVNRLRPISRDLMGRTVGILGMGRIGTALAERLAPFGVTMLYNDDPRPLTPAREAELGVSPRPFPALLAESEVLSLHVPLTETTHHIINADALARMQPGAVLINAARGPVVDEVALYESLKRGHLGAAGLDVYDVEPLAKDSPLLGLPNVVLTPHIAAGTRDALATKMRAVFANVQRFYRGEPMANAVDLAAEMAAD